MKKPRGLTCLLLLVIIIVVVILISAVIHLTVLYVNERNENALREQAIEQQQQQEKQQPEKTEETVESLLDKATDLGLDPSKELVDGKLSTMKEVRDKAVNQQATIKSRLKNAQASFERLRGERMQLERRLAQLTEEFNKYPDDEQVADELAQCDEDLETKNREILQMQADIKLLKDYDYRMEQEVAVLSKAIRDGEAAGKTIFTSAEYEALKNDLGSAHGASSAINELRKNMDGKTMDVSTGVAGEKARKRERLEKYRKNDTQEP